MKLDDYLTVQNLSLGAFAKKASLSKATVSRAREAVVVRSRRTMEKIERATDGAVTRVDLIAAMNAEPVLTQEEET